MTDLLSVFDESARRQAGRVCIDTGTHTVHYAEARALAMRWAAGLSRVTGGRARRVGIFAARPDVAYLGILAALYAGAAFVPLNPRYPRARTNYMIEHAAVDALIGDETVAGILDAQSPLHTSTAVLLPNLPRRQAPAFDGRMLCQEDFQNLEPVPPSSSRPDSDGLAYLMFTSGTTGLPKGVPISHGNLLAFLGYCRERYDFCAEDRFCQSFDLTFDLSLFTLFMAWSSGASIHPMQPVELLAPGHFVRQRNISVWFSVPSVIALADRRGALAGNSMPSLRWSLFCGEALQQDHALAWHTAAPASRIENLYGPTELTIACTAHRWTPGEAGSDGASGIVPIGKVFPALRAEIVDEQLRPVAAGETGELCVAGPQTAAGYWKAPETTATRFVQLGGQPGQYYRTGDLVKEAGNGDILFLGRTDQQVKLQGYRIELLEVEAVLRRAGCQDAVALVTSRDGENSLVAAVTGPADVGSIQRKARELLPHYMLPRRYHHLAAFPLSPNGKVDRGAIRELIDIRAADREAYAPG